MANHEKIQPQDLESEKSLLGAMMLSQDAVAIVIGKVTADSFYKPSHGTIFQAIIDLFNKHEPIDLVTVSNELKKAAQGLMGGHFIQEVIYSLALDKAVRSRFHSYRL